MSFFLATLCASMAFNALVCAILCGAGRPHKGDAALTHHRRNWSAAQMASRA